MEKTVMLTPKEIKKYLNLGKDTTYKLISQPDIPKIIIGRKILVPEDKFLKYLEKHMGKKILVD